MATIYVGPTSAGAADGTSWANRYGSLNAAEDRPITAGDTVYVGPGTYRETLTVDVSGTAGNPITYIGDYTGANTDGVGGVVRITGSNNDTTVTRATAITATAARNYRTFRGFLMDGCSNPVINWSDGTNLTVDGCVLSAWSVAGGNDMLSIAGAGQLNHAITNCRFHAIIGGGRGVAFTNSSTVDNTGSVVTGCLFDGTSIGVSFTRVGGIAVRNCAFIRNGSRAVTVLTALAAGQTITVNNCAIVGGADGVRATAVGEITENYNAFFGNATDRTNVSSGANSVAYPLLLDMRWFFETVNGGALVTPFDMASYCALVELNSGTGAPSTDMRGASVTGTYREWGPLEYNATLAIEGGGGLLISPLGSAIIAARWGGQ